MSEKNFIELNEKSSIGTALANANLYDDTFCKDKSVGGLGRTFENWDANLSIKSDYGRGDYEYFRDKESQPKNRRQILNIAQQAYDKVGIVRNVIDLMADFGIKGIRLSHTIPSVQRFYEAWGDRVELVERSERFLNTLYRLGTVAVYRNYNSVPDPKLKEMKSIGAKKIPLKYSFVNPSTLDVYGENISSFTTKHIYVLTLPSYFYEYIEGFSNADREKIFKEITADLAPEIREAIRSRKRAIVLDQDKLSVFHYKKDDWSTWGKPVTFPIMNDLVALEKLKLADISALDGAISNVRLWRIGKLTDSPSTTIIPTKSMIAKLKSILDNNVGGGTLDLVWGPELDFVESNTQIHNFLGGEKYKPTLDAIYDGLGIPLILRGDADHSNGTNFMSLKTLIERLNYGRNLLVNFWNHEIKLVQKAMGFTKPAVVEFDNMVLTDEAAEKQLIINLADRDIISHDTVCEKFGIMPEIENSRIKREAKKRGDAMPEKASPYHNPEKIHEYKKILLSGGTITPSEIGIELDERKPQEVSRIERQLKYKDERKSEVNTSGRPKNVIETTKRDKRTNDNTRTARAKELLSWCANTQSKVNDFITKAVLQSLKKSDSRTLSKQEKRSLEKLKAHCLFNISPFSEVNNQVIYQAFSMKYNDENYEDIESILTLTTTLEQKRSSLAMLYFLNNNDF